MSYLHLKKGIPDFSKAVISLWFRVPSKSINAVTGTTYIPLVTSGGKDETLVTSGGEEEIETKIYDTVYKDIAVWHYTPADGQRPIMAIADFVEADTTPVDPTFIGIDCSGPDATSLHLIFNIQLKDRAPLESVVWVTTKVDIYQLVPGITFEAGNGKVFMGGSAYGIYSIKDVSYIRTAQPERFYVLTEHVVEPDQWHHLLLSFDLSGKVKVGQPHSSTKCKLWYAIDDINYDGQENLQPSRDEDDGLGVNDVVTQNIYRVSGGEPGPTLFFNHWVPAATGDYLPEKIPSKDKEFGIPASTKYVDNIYQVEMAEFQMWTDVTLDTKKESNRRAFIDFERDIYGNIILNDDGKGALKPVNPKRAEELLGKRQDVLLHGSTNWTTGYNTGSTGVEVDIDDKGNEVLTKKPDGQFQPVAKIRQYKPDPSLKKSPGE